MNTHHVFVRCPVCEEDIPKAYAGQHARKEHPDSVNNEVEEKAYQGVVSVLIDDTELADALTCVVGQSSKPFI